MDTRKRNIIAAIMVAMFLGAVEGTVVTTAMPTIARDLSGFELISWVFSLYLLTSAVSTPIYGKLADLYGRKSVLCIGIIIFLTGSSLCGLSQNMYELIIFRSLQGLGAGSIFTVTYTIVGDEFTLSERAKVQGWLGTVWGISSLAGPLLGGFLIDNLSWHWIFYINLPFGIFSIILLQKNLHEDFERKKHKIDFPGAFVLSMGIISLLYSILTTGEKNSVPSYVVVILIALSGIMLWIFYYIEKRAKEPIIPFDIFTRTNILVNVISFLSSAVLIGADVYLPIYTQNVLGYGATISGLSIAPMSLAWVLSSVILAKAIPRYGERVVTGVSMVILLFSCLLLPTLGIQSSLLLIAIYSFIMGFGFGGAFTTLTIVVQSSVEYNKRGAATASNSLVRTLGQTIGVSILGSLFNADIVSYFNQKGIGGIHPNDLYSSSQMKIQLPLEQVIESLNSALHIVFVSLIILAVISLILSAALPNALKEK